MKNTLEFDPEMLKRFVNFMNNPDERTAVDQFGKGDKYFGVCTLMVTMPGLPMFGHGQVEGFAEKYGMEYRRAYWDEKPDQWLDRAPRARDLPAAASAPPVRRASTTSCSTTSSRDDGSVDEDVYAYSNRGGGERALVVFHNRYASSAAGLRESVAFSVAAEDGSAIAKRRRWPRVWGCTTTGLVRHPA